MAGAGGDTLTALQNGVQAINNFANKVTTAFSSVPQATTPGGSSGQVQFNNSGSFGGFTLGGDATLNSSAGILTISSNAVTYGKMQLESANTLLGNLTGSSTTVAEQPSSAVTNFLQTFSTGHQGVVSPSSVASGAIYLGGDNAFHTYTNPGFVYLGTVATISSQIVDSSTTSNILNANGANYRSFQFIIKNAVPSVASTTILFQIHSGGTFQTTGYQGSGFVVNSGGTASVTVTTGIPLSQSGNALNAAPGCAGSLTVSNITSTTDRHQFTGVISDNGLSSAQTTLFTGGYWNTVGAIDGFQVVSTGAITSGNVDVYGIL